MKKNLNASGPSEHPPARGKNVKTFRWDHNLQIQNFFMAFKQVPPDGGDTLRGYSSINSSMFSPEVVQVLVEL